MLNIRRINKIIPMYIIKNSRVGVKHYRISFIINYYRVLFIVNRTKFNDVTSLTFVFINHGGIMFSCRIYILMS